VAASTVQAGSRLAGFPGLVRPVGTGMTMSGSTEYQLPVWAPRLRKAQIERLYKSCGDGRLDEDLIDDVGFTLYARCKSLLEVGAAVRGRPVCPKCETPVKCGSGPQAMLECPACDWTCPWKAYQKTYQRKNLNAGGMAPFVREFVEKFCATHAHVDRLVLIDTLIHRFHWESGGEGGGRPGVSNLIEGRMKQTMAFLDHLNYGEQIPREIEQAREEWRKRWRRNPWSQGKGQGA